MTPDQLRASLETVRLQNIALLESIAAVLAMPKVSERVRALLIAGIEASRSVSDSAELDRLASRFPRSVAAARAGGES